MAYIFDFVILAVIYVVFFHKRWRKVESDVSLIFHLFYLYICLVVFVTLMPFQLPIPGVFGTNNLFWKSINWIPFIDLIANNGNALWEVILNVIMLVPFGFLVPFIKRHNALWTIGLALLFSLAIETMQLFYVWAGSKASRTFDITDLITNTFGAFIGYIIFLIFRPTTKRIFKKSEKHHT